MQTYKVAIAYECGFVIDVQADSLEQAEELAMESVNDVDIPTGSNVVHRDYFVVDSYGV